MVSGTGATSDRKRGADDEPELLIVSNGGPTLISIRTAIPRLGVVICCERRLGSAVETKRTIYSRPRKRRGNTHK
jgi:hypothetical protein